MAENEINEVLGLDKNETETNVNPQSVQGVDNSRSKGLKSAANVLSVLMWLSIITAVISGIVFLVNNGDDSYSDYKRIKAMQNAAIAGVWFQSSVASVFGCFFTAQLFKGISVISEAAEKYLSKK
jgi:hypothetical protein